MSSATDTNNPAPKRVRITTDEATTTPSVTPSSAAHDRVVSAIVSLPDPIKQLAEHWCAKINTAHAKHQRQTKNLTKISADPEFIPRSARVKFELTGSKLATGQDEFKALVTDAKKLVSDFQTGMKKVIVKAAEVECSLLNKERSDTIISAVVQFTEAFLLAKTGKPATPKDLIYLCTAAFGKVRPYLDALTCDTVSHQLIAETIKEDPNLVFTDEAPCFLHVSPVPVTEFTNFCEQLFVAPLQAYDKTVKDLDVNATVKDLIELRIRGTATSTTAMALDDEPTMTSAQVESLIQASIKKQTEPLRSKIKELESKSSSSAKNQPRGAKGRASLKKKSPPTTTTSGAAPKPAAAAQKAAAAANATPANNTGNTKGTGRGKSKQKPAPKTGAGRTAKK
jgi:hypothetical protein